MVGEILLLVAFHFFLFLVFFCSLFIFSRYSLLVNNNSCSVLGSMDSCPLEKREMAMVHSRRIPLLRRLSSSCLFSNPLSELSYVAYVMIINLLRYRLDACLTTELRKHVINIYYL